MKNLKKIYTFQTHKASFRNIGVLLFLLCFGLTQAQAADYYVKQGATGTGTTSFANAFATLQQALSAATSGDKIYVAAGTYIPTNQFDFDASTGSNPREVTFQIPNGVEVYGGFDGTETGAITLAVLNARNFATNITTLSGDLGNNDAITGTFPTLTYGNYTENAFHVVYTKNVSAATKVDGFTIKGGNANGSANVNRRGAGWYNDGRLASNISNPSLSNIIFSQNTAIRGGGMYNEGNVGTSSPTLTNCTFSDNAAEAGGGMFNNGDANGVSSPSLTDCLFLQNTASAVGGGMYNYGDDGVSSPILINCIFSQNNSDQGGGMYNDGASGVSSPVITNCSFSQNTADFGGGMSNNVAGGVSRPVITNCSFSQNRTLTSGFSVGAAIYIFGDGGDASTQVTNTIFDRNDRHIVYNDGNANTQPRFVNCTFSGASVAAINIEAWDSGLTPIDFVNCIFWNNTAMKTGDGLLATLAVTYSIIEDAAYSGTGNLLNPSSPFVNAATGDLRLRAGSPALNVGDNAAINAAIIATGVTTDLAGNARIQSTIVDMGAYEGFVAPPQTEFYVKIVATGTGTGTDFANATTLQQALATATSGNKIYVAAGTYIPTVSVDVNINSTLEAREVTFQIPNGVEVYGGFAGTETGAITLAVLNARNFVTNTSILSGDISGNDAVTGTFPTLTYGSYTENAFHVVYTKNVTAATKVDGFTIKSGNANGTNNNRNGAGWFNDASTSSSSNPTLANIIFFQNTAFSGGAMYNSGNSGGITNPNFTNCSFSQNNATGTGGGGAMYNEGSDGSTSSPTFTNCSFSQNTAGFGGGIYNDGFDGISSPILTNCTFSQNTARMPSGEGGGMYNDGFDGISSPTLTNCTFSDNAANAGAGMYNSGNNGISSPSLTDCSFLQNTANFAGGGMYNNGTSGVSSPILIDCIFSQNVATTAGGAIYIYAQGGDGSAQIINTIFDRNNTHIGYDDGNVNTQPKFVNCTFSGASVAAINIEAWNSGQTPLDFINCIFWNNTAMKIGVGGTATLAVTYSIIEDAAYAGTGNLLNPSSPFVNAATGDLRLQAGSPALNVGDNAAITATGVPTDFAGNARIQSTIVDMGAYEGFVAPPQTEFYVKIASTGTGVGTDFANATTLQQALSLATSGNKIYVAAGIYIPTNQFDFDGIAGSNAREVTFQIPNGVEVYGGFAGTETGGITLAVLNARNFVTHASILSGDLGNNDAVTGTFPTLIYGSYTENAFHVVYTKNVSAATKVDGFSISGGNANSITANVNGEGAGWYNDGNGTGNSSNPSLSNIIFFQNTAMNGGGMYNNGEAGTSSPSLTNCSFSQNTAVANAGGFYAHGSSGVSNPVLTNCSFSQNTANRGSGMYIDGGGGGNGNAILINCSFSQNNAIAVGGGALYIFGDGGNVSTQVTNTIFDRNNTHIGYDDGNANQDPTFINCTFTGATQAAIDIEYWDSGLTPIDFVNCIFWNNTAMKIGVGGTATLAVTYSIIEDAAYAGTGNLLNPSTPFVNAATGDLRLLVGSPALNVGNNAAITATGVTTDFAGNARIVNTIVDMGAYEKGAIVVPTPTPTPPAPTPSSPTGFTSTTVSPTQINLNWNPVSSNVTGYQVFQNGVLIATLPLGTTSYQITGLSPNTFYLFTIVAINRSNSGIITSGAVSAREWTFPENPTLLGISTLCESGQATVGLSSSANVYRIYDQAIGGNLVVESYNGSFLLPNVSKTTTFYAASFGSGSNKESQSRTAITVTVEPIFEAKIKGDKTRFSCDKSTVLEAELVENALRYTWFRNGVEVGTGPVFEAAFSADYQVRISRGVCSFVSEKINVQVGFTPIANIAQSNFARFCDKGTLNAIQTNTNATYKWLLNNVVIGEGTSLSVSQSGTYALQVTQNGCQSTAQVEVVVTTGTSQTPVLEISQTAICEGNEVTISVKNPQPNVVYQWLVHGRNFDVIGNSIKVSMVGRYSVRAISLQNSACSSAISNEVEFSTIRTTPIYMRVSEDNKTLFLEDVNFSQADIKSIEWFFQGKVATSLGTANQTTPKEDGYYSAQVVNQNGCKVQTRTVHFIVTKTPIITGEDDLKTDVFTIYPNPSNGMFNVRFPSALIKDMQVSVFDATGKAIKTQTFEKNNQNFVIDIKGMSKGIYLIRFNQENATYSKSIVLE